MLPSDMNIESLAEFGKTLMLVHIALKKYFLEKTENPKKLSKAPKKYFIDIGDEYSHYNWNAEFLEYRYKSNGETVKELN